jgi:hypothetical protein
VIVCRRVLKLHIEGNADLPTRQPSLVLLEDVSAETSSAREVVSTTSEAPFHPSRGTQALTTPMDPRSTGHASDNRMLRAAINTTNAAQMP